MSSTSAKVLTLEALSPTPLAGRVWRCTAFRWRHDPLATGSHRNGGRYNPRGMMAIYLSLEMETAFAEFTQGVPRPCALIPFHCDAVDLVDLRRDDVRRALRVDDAFFTSPWRRLDLAGAAVPSWALAERLYWLGAIGVLTASVARPGGTNLVLWAWGAFSKTRLAVVDEPTERAGVPLVW